MAVPALDPALQQLRVRARSAGRVPVAVAQPVERPSLDNAVSRAAASVTGISSSVAGDPDILVVPDIQTGTMIVTALSQFVGALTPGVVLGAKKAFQNRGTGLAA